MGLESMERAMKNLIRGSIVALIGAGALMAAYASLSARPPTSPAKPTAAHAIEAPAAEPHSGASAAAPASSRLAAAPAGFACGDCLVAAIADCDVCLAAADEAGDPLASFDDLKTFAAADGDATALADFRAGPVPAGLAFEANSALAAPTPEISTVAMAALGVVMLTGRARRKAWTGWKAAWTNPALA